MIVKTNVQIRLALMPKTKCACGGAGEYRCGVHLAGEVDLCGPCARQHEDVGVLRHAHRLTQVTT